MYICMYRLKLGFINLMKKLKMLLLQEVLSKRVKSDLCVYIGVCKLSKREYTWEK